MRSFAKMLRVLGVALLCFINLSALAYARAIKTYDAIPLGFIEYTVKAGDTWDSITSSADKRELAMRVNRIDQKNLRAGSQILVPISSEAHDYTPVPEVFSSHKRQLVVFLDVQYFGAYENGELVRWGPISSGTSGHATPLGSYRALWFDKWHRSSLYNNARMYYAVQFKGNYFIHEQALPGYPASHGCVRFMKSDAEVNFSWLRSGDPITVVRNADAFAS